MATKASETISDEQAKAIHSEINAETSVDGRKKIYARHGLTVGTGPRLFKEKGLSKVIPAKISSKTKPAAGKASKKTTKGPAKATATAPTPEPKKKAPAPKSVPAKKAPSGLDEDVRQLIALQARVISRLMGNE